MTSFSSNKWRQLARTFLAISKLWIIAWYITVFYHWLYRRGVLELFIMCKAWHQYNERPRALALLNSPQMNVAQWKSTDVHNYPGYHCHRPEAFYQILTCLIWALWVHVTYLFTKCVTESCDSPDWLIQYCLSSASSRVTETVSMKMPCGECFQKCFSAYNMISLWLNTIMPIIVMIWLPKMTRYLHWRIIYWHLKLVTF